MILFPVLAASVVAIIFYVALPLIGAFAVRSQWRFFRTSVIKAYGYESLDARVFGAPSPRLGRFKAHGEVEAIEGEYALWARSSADGTQGGQAFVVNLRGAWVYVLTGGDEPDAIARARWTAIPSLLPRMRVFVAGEAMIEGGRLVMGAGREPPLVILHDGKDEELLVRSVRAGRQGNEYWNPVSQISLPVGMLAMSVLMLVSLNDRTPALVSAMALCLALSPALTLLPPGVVGFFAYRQLWAKARTYRARRDLVALKPGNEGLAAKWISKARKATIASGACFVAALAVNAWIVFVVLWRFVL